MRVVLDTNILISACLKPEGLEAQVTAMAASGKLQCFVSKETADEYRDVLFRSKFAPFHKQAEVLLNDLGRKWIMVTPLHKVTAASDDDDNRFLECAQAAAAGFLITGNLRHYPETWASARVLNARTFLTEACPPRSLC